MKSGLRGEAVGPWCQREAERSRGLCQHVVALVSPGRWPSHCAVAELPFAWAGAHHGSRRLSAVTEFLACPAAAGGRVLQLGKLGLEPSDLAWKLGST